MYYFERKFTKNYERYDKYELVNENKDLIVYYLLECGMIDLANEAYHESKFNQPRYVSELAKSAPDNIIKSLKIRGLLHKGVYGGKNA